MIEDITPLLGRIHQTDCLPFMRSLPDKCVDLVLTDPPYFNFIDAEWDNVWGSEKLFLEWMGGVLTETKRILKSNGSIYVFCSPILERKVEIEISKNFNILSNIRWIKKEGWHKKACKEEMRSWSANYESIIFSEQKSDQYVEAEKALHKDVYAPLGRYIQQERERSGLTRNEVEVALGFVSSTDPTRGTALCYRWEEGSSLPTKETYEKMRAILNSKGGEYLRREYEDLRREYEDLRREYEDLRRPFTVSSGVNFTSTWDFMPVGAHDNKHPCEKPIPLIEHMLKASSKKGGVVFDPFMGSGSTAVGAEIMGRKWFGCELEPKYCEIANKRIAAERNQLKLF